MRAHAHCDYDNGFLVFDRLGHAKEIWRLVCDAGEGETASHAPPDDKQTKYHEQSYARHPVTVDNRGHFRPWALISYPEKTLAFRFVYPTLLTSGEHHIYLHDVRTGEQIRVLENAVLDSSPAWNMVTYLELSERHVFIATEDWVRVFSRADGSQLLTLRKSAQDSYHHITVEPKTFLSRLSSDAVLVPQVLKHGRDNEVGNEFVAGRFRISQCEFTGRISDSQSNSPRIRGWERHGDTTRSRCYLPSRLGAHLSRRSLGL